MKKNRIGVKKFIKRNLPGYLAILPMILGILIFSVYPVISTLIYSFHSYNILQDDLGAFTFEQYQTIFGARWSETLSSLEITFLYALIMIPFNLIISFFLALWLQKQTRFNKVMRLLIYLPCLIPIVVSGIVWAYVADTRMGIGNAILNLFGASWQFFDSANTSFTTLIIFSMFGVGSNLLIWLSSLKAVPKNLYEAASIDGANPFHKLIHVTLPAVSPFIIYNLLVSLIGTLQIFANVYTITGGTAGKEDSLLFFVIYIYREAFSGFNISYASALSWVLFIIIAVIIFVLLKTSKWVYYGDE